MCVCVCVCVCVHVCVKCFVMCVPVCMLRIDATREICTLLKNHIARTEDVLAVGEIDKETLHQVDKQRVDEYQVLHTKHRHR